MSLFEKATKNARRLKMLIYGDTGTGKTVTALHFPNPAVVDTEGGTEHYGKIFDFDVNYSADMGKIENLVDELLKDSRGYKSLVIDPWSNIYDRMISDRQLYLRKKKGIATYEITGLDYAPLKGTLKRFLGKLKDLDMNIIMTTGVKPIYAEGEFMKQIGTQADAHKEIPKMFDVVIELTLDRETGIRTAHVDKDRTNTLEAEFEFSYEALTKAFGIEDLERDAVTFNTESKLKNRSGRNTTIMHGKTEMMTAGITTKQLTALEKIMKNNDQEQIMQKLQGDCGVASFLDLREDEAELFINEINQK